MGVKLFLIRHGQTSWNLQKKYQGTSDIELNETGIMQAELAAEYLRDVDFASIYSSPLKRTTATAEIIGRNKDKHIKVKEGLKEVSFGKWEGLTFDQIDKEYGADYQKWLNDPFSNAPTGGENFKHLIGRANREIESIIEENEDGSTVAVSTHGGVIVALLVYWLRIPAQRWRSITQRQAAINVAVIHNGFPYISQVNYTGHLNSYYSHDEDKVIDIYSKIKKE